MSNFTKPMKRSLDILTRLFDKDKWMGKDGKPHYPKGRKGIDTLKENISIVFAEGDELEYIAEFSFKGPTNDASGSSLLCRLSVEDMEEIAQPVYIVFSLSGEMFNILEIPAEVATSITLTEVEQEPAEHQAEEKEITKEDVKKNSISTDDDRQENLDYPKSNAFMNPPSSSQEEKEEEVEEDDFIRSLGMTPPFEEELPDLPII